MLFSGIKESDDFGDPAFRETVGVGTGETAAFTFLVLFILTGKMSAPVAIIVNAAATASSGSRLIQTAASIVSRLSPAAIRYCTGVDPEPRDSIGHCLQGVFPAALGHRNQLTGAQILDI